ncbi:unnamed protein product [Scytosiphon promiscuus]
MKVVGEGEREGSGTHDGFRRNGGGGAERNHRDTRADEGSENDAADQESTASQTSEGLRQPPTPKHTKSHGHAKNGRGQHAAEVEPFQRHPGQPSVSTATDTESDAESKPMGVGGSTVGCERSSNPVVGRQPTARATRVTADVTADNTAEKMLEHAVTPRPSILLGKTAALSTKGGASVTGARSSSRDETEALTFPAEASRAGVGGSDGGGSGGGRKGKSGTTAAKASRDGAGDFYRAALSTHLSFIATTADDDIPPPIGCTRGGSVGRGSEGKGVGDACRVLRGDVAGVRQRLEAVQSKFFEGTPGPTRAKELSSERTRPL